MSRKQTRSIAEATEKSRNPFEAVARRDADEMDALLASLTDDERERVRCVAKRARLRAAGPAMELTLEGNTIKVTYAHSNPEVAAVLLMADIGTCDPFFYQGITQQITSLGAPGSRVDGRNSNFVLAVIRAVQPRDELESMLATQMGAIHAATMMMARRLNHVETIPQQDAAERALNKLARTFSTQLDTLKRYRSGGQQRVVVEHVTVNEGGQAIVGSVATGGRGSNEK